MKFISRDQILATFKTYSEIRSCIFNDRIEKSCGTVGVKTITGMNEFRENKNLNCSCLKFSDFRSILRFYYRYNLSNIADGMIVEFKCCPDSVVEYNKLNENHYLVKPHNIDLVYEQIETYVNADKKGQNVECFCQSIYIHIACIMLYNDNYDSLAFFSNIIEKNDEEFEKTKDYHNKIDRFIYDFKEAVKIYYTYLNNKKKLSSNYTLPEEFAKNFFIRVCKYCKKDIDCTLYSSSFTI